MSALAFTENTTMRSAILRSLAFAAISFGFLAASRGADDGYVELFNGKDLTGWVYPGMKGKALDGRTETPDKRFEVTDKIIVANVGKGIKDLYTAKSYDKDFIFKCEFRAGKRADSGVYIRGKQLQVRDYPALGPYKDLKKFKDGDWNELIIKVTGDSAECTCNGEVLEKAFKVPAKGAIGLQAESGKFEFRNVRIKE
jgi:hypothetical protein